jgi:hypothetical protein
MISSTSFLMMKDFDIWFVGLCWAKASDLLSVLIGTQRPWASMSLRWWCFMSVLLIHSPCMRHRVTKAHHQRLSTTSSL